MQNINYKSSNMELVSTSKQNYFKIPKLSINTTNKITEDMVKIGLTFNSAADKYNIKCLDIFDENDYVSGKLRGGDETNHGIVIVFDKNRLPAKIVTPIYSFEYNNHCDSEINGNYTRFFNTLNKTFKLFTLSSEPLIMGIGHNIYNLAKNDTKILEIENFINCPPAPLPYNNTCPPITVCENKTETIYIKEKPSYFDINYILTTASFDLITSLTGIQTQIALLSITGIKNSNSHTAVPSVMASVITSTFLDYSVNSISHKSNEIGTYVKLGLFASVGAFSVWQGETTKFLIALGGSLIPHAAKQMIPLDLTDTNQPSLEISLIKQIPLRILDAYLQKEGIFIGMINGKKLPIKATNDNFNDSLNRNFRDETWHTKNNPHAFKTMSEVPILYTLIGSFLKISLDTAVLLIRNKLNTGKFFNSEDDINTNIANNDCNQNDSESSISKIEVTTSMQEDQQADNEVQIMGQNHSQVMSINNTNETFSD